MHKDLLNSFTSFSWKFGSNNSLDCTIKAFYSTSVMNIVTRSGQESCMRANSCSRTGSVLTDTSLGRFWAICHLHTGWKWENLQIGSSVWVSSCEIWVILQRFAWQWHQVVGTGEIVGLQISQCRVWTAFIGSFHNHHLSFYLSLCHSYTEATRNIKLC